MENLKEIPPVSYLILIIISAWGAYVNFTRRKISLELDNRNKFFVFLQDFCISTGVTILSFYILRGSEINELLSVGLSGYLGSQSMRSLNLFELFLIKKLDEFKKGV